MNEHKNIQVGDLIKALVLSEPCLFHNSEENLILQPPIQGKYRDDYLFFDTLTKMPLPNKLDMLLKSKELELTDEQICGYIQVLNKYKNK